ncbi:outer membrane protein OmpK [Microbulbifer elongatus]|uniref:outer membrane protein OmpK n=1 Tax=Microbulbifer elongatus TaxID=86173 RepID=UPI001E4BCA23|nr:outer membrane protein OmpK [Microbulbifer elongatus]
MKYLQNVYGGLVLLVGCIAALPAMAAEWSNTEAQLQYGRLENPFTRTKASSTILTLQHASGWKYGDNFFFVDFINDGERDGFNDSDVYAEWYPNFSLGKITGCDLTFGPVKDLGIIAGFNYSSDANVEKFLPGFRVAWNLPEGAFLNTDITGYKDIGYGDSAPKEGSSYMIDFNGAFPFSIGEQDFSIEGHIEYIHNRTSEFGDVKSWVFAQPQFRWDMGKTLFNSPKQLFVGIEYQYWRNKLGVDVTESTVQALLVWRF